MAGYSIVTGSPADSSTSLPLTIQFRVYIPVAAAFDTPIEIAYCRTSVNWLFKIRPCWEPTTLIVQLFFTPANVLPMMSVKYDVPTPITGFAPMHPEYRLNAIVQ